MEGFQEIEAANKIRSSRAGERPYARLTIGQLEGSFANGRTDRAVLRALDGELGFRETGRDRRLQVRVDKP